MNYPLYKIYLGMFIYFIIWLFIEFENINLMDIIKFFIENPALAVALASSIATICYTYITYGTLREMRKQREATYMPDIIIENGTIEFKVEKINLFNHLPIFEFCYSEGTNLESLNIHNIYFRLLNIGLGTAQHIKAEIEPDISSFKKLSERIHQHLSLNQHHEDIDFKFIDQSYNISYKFSFEKSSISGDFRKEFSRFSYILPMSISKDVKYIELAYPYKSFLDLYLRLSYFKYLQYDYDFYQSFFDFKLKITYEDIGKKEYTKSYKLSLFNHGLSKSGLLLFLGSELIE